MPLRLWITRLFIANRILLLQWNEMKSKLFYDTFERNKKPSPWPCQRSTPKRENCIIPKCFRISFHWYSLHILWFKWSSVAAVINAIDSIGGEKRQNTIYISDIPIVNWIWCSAGSNILIRRPLFLEFKKKIWTKIPKHESFSFCFCCTAKFDIIDVT